MTRAELIQVPEWGRVELPPDRDTPRWRERLLLAGRSDRGEAFRLSGKDLHARDLVGVVDAGPVQVQIVPKLYDESGPEDDASNLLRMLVIAGLPVRTDVQPGRTVSGRLPIVEPILRHVSEELHRLILSGIPRRYNETEEWSNTVRGRIDMGRLARRRPGMEHRVPIRHAPLQPDNPLTRLVRALVGRLAQATRSAKTAKLLRRSESLLAQVREVPLTAGLASEVRLTRFESEWQWVVDFACLLAGERSPDPVTAGTVGGFTLLFRLDDLFEQVVRRALSNGLAGSDVVLEGRPERNLLRTRDGQTAMELDPDLMFFATDDPDRVRHVADAKWKHLRPERPNLGLSSSDVYQISTYMRRFEVDEGWLVFPSVEPIPEGDPFDTHVLDLLPDLGSLEVVGVDVGRLLDEDDEMRKEAEGRFAELAMERCRPGGSAV